MRDRINDQVMKSGVTIIDPTTTWIDADVQIANDVVIYPGSVLAGKTTVESGAVIGPRTSLTNVTVGARAHIVESTCTDSVIGAEANVGPYSYLRPGTTLAARAKAGAYVEIKNSTIGEGSKVPHLSYVRIGSDTMLVAPVAIGDGAYTAAGSIITEDVPAGSIGVARAKQRNVLGWVLRKRAGSSSAEAAKRAGATERE